LLCSTSNADHPTVVVKTAKRNSIVLILQMPKTLVYRHISFGPMLVTCFDDTTGSEIDLKTFSSYRVAVSSNLEVKLSWQKQNKTKVEYRICATK